VETLARFLENPPPIDRAALDAWLDRFRVPAVAARYEELLHGM
jgi:hypothetical protein